MWRVLFVFAYSLWINEFVFLVGFAWMLTCRLVLVVLRWRSVICHQVRWRWSEQMECKPSPILSSFGSFPSGLHQFLPPSSFIVVFPNAFVTFSWSAPSPLTGLKVQQRKKAKQRNETGGFSTQANELFFFFFLPFFLSFFFNYNVYMFALGGQEYFRGFFVL